MADYTLHPTKAAIVSSAYPGTHQSMGATERLYYDRGGLAEDRRMLLLGIESPLPEGMLYRYITGVELMWGLIECPGAPSPKYGTTYDPDEHCGFAHYTSDFDADTVTGYDFMPPNDYNGATTWVQSLPAYVGTYGPRLASSLCQERPNTLGIVGLAPEYSSSGAGHVTAATPLHSSLPPYIDVYVGELVEISLVGLSPISGYVPKNAASQFTWGFEPVPHSDCGSFGKLTQASATFRWRAGSSGTVNTINCGTTQGCTVPAGTFTTDEIQWQVSVITNSGVTATSEWYTLSTIESLPEAVPISPVGSLVDGSVPVTFSWSHIIATGTAQSKAELQYSLNGGSSWTDLATVTGADAEYTAPANTFGAGTVSWRVRTYNSDNEPGEWSAAADFIVMVSPDAPSVSCTSGTSPRLRISWQAAGQQAYEVEVGNIKSGLQFGVVQSWICPDYLPDGQYIARVRVGNKYDLWSDWGTCAVTVANTAGEPITLTAAAAHVVELSWQTAGGYDAFFVLRDGAPIARTTARQYVDNFSAGTHMYAVRGVFAGSGDYCLSNQIPVSVVCDTVCISPVPAANWLKLSYADTQDRRTSVAIARNVEYVHLCGRKYPSTEVSDFWESSIGVVCAMREPSECAALEALAGQLVCVKDQWGNMAIGILDTLSKQAAKFFQTYSFTVSRVDHVEAVPYD